MRIVLGVPAADAAAGEVRMATGDAAASQVALAMLLALATAGGLTGQAGRIYANSVLRVGARVRVMDALRGR